MEKKRQRYFILICACLIFSAIFIGNIQHTPYRTLLLLLSGLLGFIIPMFFRNRWILIISKKIKKVDC